MTYPPASLLRSFAICIAAASLSGCLSTAASIVTAPVKAVGQVADWSTTSQDESDRNYGRRVRAREAAAGRLERQLSRAMRACDAGDRAACRDASRIADQINAADDRAPR